MVAFAFALALTVQAAPYPDGGPISLRTPSPNNVPEDRTPPVPRVRPTPAPRPDSSPPPDLAANEAISADGEPSSGDSASAVDKMPVITVHSTDNVTRGETGSFVLEMKPALMLAGMYVKFSVGGTAVAGVDYVALVSPAYIGHSGYGVIQIKTLPDRRSSSRNQAYSVVITLEDAAGYSVGIPSSATMWIKP